MPSVEQQIESARRNLLDLTLHNRLLNHRPSKARTLRIEDRDPVALFDDLFVQKGDLGFDGREEGEPAVDAAGGGGHALALFDPRWAEQPQMTRRWGRTLRTSLESEALQKRLLSIERDATSILEEQGYNALYVALWYLEWLERDDTTTLHRAPLVLVPVEIERTAGSQRFLIRWNGDELTGNISLEAKLAEQGVTLPGFEEPEDGSGLEEYITRVTAAIQPMARWTIRPDIYLDFFSFTKFVMHRDLDAKAWPAGAAPADHPLLRAMLEPSDAETTDRGFIEDDVDERVNARTSYHVADADPSQIAVIEDAKAGRNLVVEGPPGTGKSQTIVNLIAELLGNGKSVLFVSEKMAALEVVKERLEERGLGTFCLELHSRKANKREVLEELRRTVGSPIPPVAPLDELFEEHESLRRELNDYARILREPATESLGRSTYGLMAQRERATQHFGERKPPRVSLDRVEAWSQPQQERGVSALRSLAQALPLVQPIATHPLRGCDPGVVLPADEEAIQELLDAAIAATLTFQRAIEQLVQAGIRRPSTPDAASETVRAAVAVVAAPHVDPEVICDAAWNPAVADDLVRSVAGYRSGLPDARSTFTATSLEESVTNLHLAFRAALARGWIRYLLPSFWHLRREVRSRLREGQRGGDANLLKKLETLDAVQRQRSTIREAGETGRALFGAAWKAERSEPHVLQGVCAQIKRLRDLVATGQITPRSLDLAFTPETRLELHRAVEEAHRSAEDFVARMAEVEARLHPDYQQLFGCAMVAVTFESLLTRLHEWREGTARLQRWSQYLARRRECLQTVAAPLVAIVDGDLLAADDLLPCLEAAIADELLRVAFKAHPALLQFVGELHEGRIRRFQEIDRALIEHNRVRLAHRLGEARPRVVGGASPGSEAGILLGEFNRKRRHMPIRRLLAQAGGLIQKIKPCFMMSPLSVAQFLEPRTARFDVVVFDEASQVRPEDALGSVLRGRQLIVMGDTLQLPPTAFFSSLIAGTAAEEEEDAAANVADVESVLNQCKRAFPTRMLRWHYRSRHESLIAVSNQEFYRNDLLIYPSVVDRSPELGLQFFHLPDASYDRGRSSVNRREAQAVAAAVIEHFRAHGNRKSLGVGTFNIKQQQAILDEVELQRQRHPELEDFFRSSRKEHFFVKNLETIQGDERDVILLSVGFGRDENGRLTQNFGPLNSDGGERRLNVLISRAREKCIVFSNFRAQDLAVDASTKRGTRVLKVFLEYAETRHLDPAESALEDTDSPFEDAVASALRQHGHQVRAQIGCAGFRVDLAVVDPANAGRYLLGIECDGAKYHSSPVARDRDRLRQQILEGHGWRIHRVWSTDWYRNRDATLERLLSAVGRAAALPPEGPSPQCEPLVNVPVSPAPVPAEPPQAAQVLATPYVLCTGLPFSPFGDIHEQPVPRLEVAVATIVDIEGPIHLDEVVRRIRDFWGKRRAGDRSRQAVLGGVAAARSAGRIQQRGDFLWPVSARPIAVRHRSGKAPVKIEYVCDEEIGEAARAILRTQFATPLDELVVRVSRVLGIQATSALIAGRIRSVIEGLIERKQLRRERNGMVNL